MVDFIVIGAGSAGLHTAYYLNRAGAQVIVMDRWGVGAGGSGAAGAFISPRLGRGGPLQRLTNRAFHHTISLYTEEFPHLFHQTGILRLPKDRRDAERFQGYEEFIDVSYRRLSPEELPYLKPYAREFGGFLFPEGGIVDAQGLSRALLEGIEFQRAEISEIKGVRGGFQCGGVTARGVIIATGAWGALLPPYIQLGRVAGYRIDIGGELELPSSIHKRISISKKVGGRIAIGATHTRIEDPNSLPPLPPVPHCWMRPDPWWNWGRWSSSLSSVVSVPASATISPLQGGSGILKPLREGRGSTPSAALEGGGLSSEALSPTTSSTISSTESRSRRRSI
ncbi:MAG: FAD-binding oxidoreductase [Epsilonproteobacteria bacterium]|nr:hypothetical protein [Campylobacterota bacterium]NPA57200.1 FAD-binding oxidoreductase [Campylobacterota bacterium]